MKYLNKKSKQSPEPPQQHILWGIPANVAVGPLGFRAELDVGPKDGEDTRVSRIVPHDQKAEDQGPPTPRTSTPDVAVGGDEHGNDPTEEDTAGIGEGEGGTAVASRVLRREWINTALGGAGILLDVVAGTAEAFGPLKAVLTAISAIYANYEETVAVRKKIQDLCSRVAVLEGIYGVPTNDVAEQRRRNELLRKFKGIEGQLRSLSEKPGLRRLADHVQDDEEVSGLLEDLQEDISNYQMVQQIAIHEQGRKLIDAAEATVLNNIRCAQAAEYRHGDREGCLKGTRRAVMDEIEVWIRDFDKPPVYWLNGLAGTGKTTIAQTIAERTFANGQLGASFFCSRDFLDRSNLQFIFPTLAVQLARKHTEFRSILVPLIQSDPGIVDESLYHQMEKLIVQPLKESAISTVIVVDALDECKDYKPASAILSVLGQFVSEIPQVKFFLTGRPEPRIREGFRLPQLAKATDVFVLHEVEPSQVYGDIRLFFRHSSLETADRQGGLDDWPTEEQLDLLCQRAAGLFVYAVATVGFVDSRNNNPKKRLDRLLLSPERSAPEGKTKFKEEVTLDLLYMSVLQEGFGCDDPEDDPRIRSVLGAVVLASNPLSPSAIAALLCLDTEDVFPLLSSVHSLLILQEDANHPVRPFHKSFPDFIVDPTRCTIERFRVSPPNQHSELLIGCLELMNRRLEKNMCKIPDAVANFEVDDLRERTERYIDHGLRYACESWHKHFVDAHTAPTHTPKITSVLHWFLEEKFLFWLEALSALGTIRHAVDALEVAAKWLGVCRVSQTLDLVNDYFLFVTGFFEPISTSASHVYRSALLLSPRTSIVRRLYERHAHPSTRVVRGLPMSWDPSMMTVTFPDNISHPTWSPCSRLIAIAPHSREGIQILDAVTLKRVKTLTAPWDCVMLLAFSPGSRLLTCSTHFSPVFAIPVALITWDLQTGVPVSEITFEAAKKAHSITYSGCRTMCGVLLETSDYTAVVHSYVVHTYDVLSGIPIHFHPVEGRVVELIWTHGECFRFATLGPGSITIWEVGFTSEHPPTVVKSLPTPNNFDPSDECLFLPTLSRLAFVLEKTTLVWDAQNSKVLLSSVDAEWTGDMTFSPDGGLFACGTEGLEVYLWKESPTGYILHQKLISSPSHLPYKPFLSPNGQLIVASCDRALRLWRVTDSTPLPSSVPIQHAGFFILGFSPDESLAAAAQSGGNTVTVLNLKSGTPRLIIDADMVIYGLRIAGSTVVVVGDGTVTTWNMPAGDSVINARATINDSVRATTFNYRRPAPSLELTPPPTASISPNLEHIAIEGEGSLDIYSVSTGEYLMGTHSWVGRSWWTPDGRQVWGYKKGERGWAIPEHRNYHAPGLERLYRIRRPVGGFPWDPPHGYQVMDDGWILSPSGRRLLWLPPHWQVNRAHSAWGGQFLALLDPQLPEIVILEVRKE